VTEAARPEAAATEAGDDPPLRVSTLELFFDLVFVFTITQLTGLLARDHVTAAGAVRVLLIFGVLWWMYGAYAWLTNARTPSRTPERLLLLLGMAGFLIIGLAIPKAFDQRGDGLALGLGYLLVVTVHGTLYQRVNRNILRVVPINATAAVLVILAGVIGGNAAYALWAVALAGPVISPLIVHPKGRFSIQPSHFVERHGALVIVVFGESVADIGIGAAGHPLTVSLIASAVLGLALTATLWWAYFGVADDERAEDAFSRADPAIRPALALHAYWYAYIPMLLGIVSLAAGIKVAMLRPGASLPWQPSLMLGGGVALFLAGDVVFRNALRIGPLRYRAGAAVVALAASTAGVASSAAEIALLAAVVTVALIAEPRGSQGQGGLGGMASPRPRGASGGRPPDL
jgi:low temperature requirement protein LtrA